jgi:cytidylate kinase
MNTNRLSEPSRERILGDLVERACQQWQTQESGTRQRDRSQPTSGAVTIALSRETGTRATSIAQEAGRLLGWHVYDHELLDRIAHDMGVRTTLLNSVDERVQSWILESVAGFLKPSAEPEWTSQVMESAFDRHLIETVLALGVHGECLIVGRGCAFILPPETTLRVRLVGPVKERTLELASQLGISVKEAARQLRTKDRERNDFVQDLFSKDPADPRNYDQVLNTSRFSVADCAELIVEALHRFQAARSPSKVDNRCELKARKER